MYEYARELYIIIISEKNMQYVCVWWSIGHIGMPYAYNLHILKHMHFVNHTHTIMQ